MRERLRIIHAHTYQTGDGSENHTCRGDMASCGGNV